MKSTWEEREKEEGDDTEKSSKKDRDREKKREIGDKWHRAKNSSEERYKEKRDRINIQNEIYKKI